MDNDHTEIDLLVAPKTVGPKEAAMALGISIPTIHRWRKQGKIDFVTLPSGQVRFRVDEVRRIQADSNMGV